MYNSFNRDTVENPEASTKYTEYLKTLDGSFYSNHSKAGRQRQRSNPSHQNHRSQPLQALSNNEVKFSNIFSPTESNALKLQLMQKTASLPLLDQDSNNNHLNSTLIGGATSVDDVNVQNSRRRSTASGLVHANSNSNRTKGDSVANILYSTIRHGHEYENPSADETLHTGSDSKVDYDPHEPLPAVDQIALRHELLNNIRAISRATYFEDLYTGKVRRNSGSPEAEILRLLENPQEAALAVAAARDARTIPSNGTSLSRVDRWIKESSEASSRNGSNDTDEEKGGGHKLKQNTSLYHQTMWKEDKKNNKRDLPSKQIKTKGKKGGSEGTTTESSSYLTESDEAENATDYNKQSNSYKTTKYVSPYDKSSRLDKHFASIAEKSNVVTPTVSKLHSKHLGSHVGTVTDSHGKRRPFSFGYDDSNDIPLSVSLPNVAQTSTSYRSTPVPMHDTYSIKSYSTSRPENLNYSTSVITKNPNHVKAKKQISNNNANNNNIEQVRRVHQLKPGDNGARPIIPKNGPKRGAVTRQSNKYDKVPGIYARLNMNQYVMKKVWFYVNGDEHVPRFEYRFRHGKDIRDMDQLLDLLTKRFPTLPTGARFIFTVDGYLINSLEELVNENSYVVSSTRKFKALKYGNDGDNGENSGANEIKKGTHRSLHYKPHQGLSKQLSSSEGNINSKTGRLGDKYGASQSYSNLSKVSGSKSVSDVPKLVAHVIEEASVSGSSPSFRQPIRVINGLRPSLQSQVLLNTRTSQPFEDLVRDLALSVRVPKQPIGNTLQTLAGRQIRSYSQLRSELKAGQRTFYVYTYRSIGEETKNPGNLLSVNQSPYITDNGRYIRNRNGKPMAKATLGKVDSNSSSDFSEIENQNRRKSQIQRRSRSHTDNSFLA